MTNIYQRIFTKKSLPKKKGVKASNNGEMLNVILGCWHGDDRKHNIAKKDISVV
jgi:hypothetical protein